MFGRSRTADIETPTTRVWTESHRRDRDTDSYEYRLFGHLTQAENHMGRPQRRSSLKAAQRARSQDKTRVPLERLNDSNLLRQISAPHKFPEA